MLKYKGIINAIRVFERKFYSTKQLNLVDELKCEICSKKVTTFKKNGVFVKAKKKGKLYFCSEKCYKENGTEYKETFSIIPKTKEYEKFYQKKRELIKKLEKLENTRAYFFVAFFYYEQEKFLTSAKWFKKIIEKEKDDEKRKNEAIYFYGATCYNIFRLTNNINYAKKSRKYLLLACTKKNVGNKAKEMLTLLNSTDPSGHYQALYEGIEYLKANGKFDFKKTTPYKFYNKMFKSEWKLSSIQINDGNDILKILKNVIKDPDCENYSNALFEYARLLITPDTTVILGFKLENDFKLAKEYICISAKLGNEKAKKYLMV